MSKSSSPFPFKRQEAFTLLEVLIVVAIIALLTAILLPAMSHAKEQARRAACLSNMSHLAKAVVSFSTARKGWGQLYADWDYVDDADPSHTRYTYQTGWFDASYWQGRPVLKPWPVAYGSDLGIPSLRRADQYFLDETEYLQGYAATENPDYHFSRFGRFEPFYCPSDRFSIRESKSPERVYGVLSYAINEDVFGARKDLQCHGPNGPKDRLEGRLDHIVRPGEVALFTDAGHEQLQDLEDQKSDGSISILAGGYVPTSFYSRQGSPFLNQVLQQVVVAVPAKRHSTRGGINIAYADGHAAFADGTEGYVASQGDPAKRYSGERILVPRQYRPRAPRVTPYNP